MRNKGTLIISIFTLAVSCAILTSCFPWPAPIATHTAKELGGLSEIWSLKNIYNSSDSFTPTMVAGNGKVIFDGGMSIFAGDKINCLDGMNGNVSWEKSDRWPETALFAASDGIYVGYSGIPHVKKYDYATGDILWSHNLSGRGLRYLYGLGDTVQVTTDSITVLDKLTGNVLRSNQDWQGGKDIYIIADDVTYIRPISALKTNSGEVIWQQFDLDSELYLEPVFLDDKILLRTGSSEGSIYSLDSATGRILWKTENNIISSISYSYSSGKIYALSKNGELLSIDRDSGKPIVIAEFTSTPFVISGEAQVGAYEVAFDDNNQMLYVLLGDSRQLFAFRVKQD